MSEISIQEASNELAKMARFAEAYAGARKVIDTLLAAEQVKGELEKAIASRRDELQKVNETVIKAQQTARTLDTNAKAVLDEAHRQQAKIIADAKAEARDVLAVAESRAEDLDREIAEKEAKLADLAKAIETDTAQHDDLSQKITAMREKIRAMVGD